MEHFLWVAPEASDALARERRDRIEEEIADIAIYLIELSDNVGVNLLEAIQKKLARNAGKYPVSKARGKSTKYTEL